MKAKLYLDNAPAVGGSGVEIKQEDNNYISSAIPIGGNIKFSSYKYSWRNVLIIKLPVPPLKSGFKILYIIKVLATLRIGSIK